MPPRPADLVGVVGNSVWITPRRLAAILAILTAIAVTLISLEVFPYRSINHDEGVYLHQASMLLDGQLVLDPPVEDAFRPWFFVAQEGVLYPKYAPVPAGVFAGGMLLGDAHIALAAVAAVTVGLTYATVAEVFDPRIGLVSAALLAATPLFLIQSSVFLPYVPTLALLLLFAWTYLRGDRTGDLRWASAAGVAVGLAFFARPYTAVLFALPFVGHAFWTMHTNGRVAVRRQAITAVLGLGGVGVALGYNALLTGSPFLFPYQAFGPLDGPGFGRRALLGHEVVYDLDLAIETARIALSAYVLRWSVAPPLGVGLAAIGLGDVLRRGRPVDARVLPLAGLIVSIPLGQLAFWGTLNAIGSLESPGLGLLGHLGPFYHLGLIVPTAAFAAVALVRGFDHVRARVPPSDRRRRIAAVLVIAVLLAGVVSTTAVAGVADPIQQNQGVTSTYETAYAPFDDQSLENALVFLPMPYGPWLAHPFQYLRNDPDFDGPTLYALDRDVFDVVAAFPDRTLFRYAYRGDWVPADGESVAPVLRRLSHVSGPGVRLDVAAGVPTGTESVVVSLHNGAGDRVTVPVDQPADDLRVTLTIDGEEARLSGPRLESSRSIPVDARDELAVTAFVDTGGLDSFEYELALPVRHNTSHVEAITPRHEVCADVQQCEEGAAYVPGRHPVGVELDTELSAVDPA